LQSPECEQFPTWRPPETWPPFCRVTGQDILRHSLSISDLDRWVLVAILFGIGVVYRILFYLSLRFKHKPEKS
jgi:hypothetical protein